MAGQPQFSAPAAGEVITTGTVTDAYVIAPGERWESDYGALGVEGLTVRALLTAHLLQRHRSHACSVRHGGSIRFAG